MLVIFGVFTLVTVVFFSVITKRLHDGMKKGNNFFGHNNSEDDMMLKHNFGQADFNIGDQLDSQRSDLDFDKDSDISEDEAIATPGAT